MHKGVPGGYKRFPGIIRGDRGLQWVTGNYKGLQGLQGITGVTSGYMVLQLVTRGYKGIEKTCFLTRMPPDTFLGLFCRKRLQGVTRRYKELQGVTRGYKRLQGVTAGYKGFQGVPRGYGGFQTGTGDYKV